jgi:hypothetical protein
MKSPSVPAYLGGGAPEKIEPSEEGLSMDQIHEFASYTFKADISMAGQAETMERIGAATAGCLGLVSRDFFFSEPDRRWIAHVIWEDEASIEAAAAIVEDPDVAALFDQLESESMTYGRFRRAGGTVAPTSA